MATYVNDLRLKEIATGDEAGTWGASTNTNLELIAEAFSYGTEASFGSDADATTTIADGSTDPARSLYLKVTSGASLTATRTLTIAPNTVSKIWIIENATSGSQSINISQGSGANVTIPSGKTKIVYSDGAGSGAAVVDALASLNLETSGIIETSSSIQTPLIEYTDGDDAMTIADGGQVTFAQNIIGTLGTAAQPNITSVGTLTGLTTSGDINFGDSDKAVFGAGSDLQIYHDGYNSYISDSGAGDLLINSDGTNLKLRTNSTENAVVCANNGAVTLYYDNAVKIATTSTGIDVTGTVVADGLTVDTNTLYVDSTNNRVGIGTASPADKLEIGTTTTGGNLRLVSSSYAGNGLARFYGTDGNEKLQIGTLSATSAYIYTPASTDLVTYTGGSERMRIASNGRVSIGTTSTNAGLHVANSDIRCTGAAVANDANSISMSQEATGGFIAARGPDASTRGTISLSVNASTGGSGIVGLKVENTGNVTISGALSKGSGSFKIDHPLESKKDTHHLVHSFVEAPQADNIYRGVVTLVDGSATINLDTEAGMTEGTFVLLNTNTSCFTSNESDWDAVKGSVSGNILTISCQNTSSTATVSWLVIGERQDQHMLDTDWTDENGKVIVEPLKIVEPLEEETVIEE